MQLSEFTFRIILLFVPGMISFIIISALTSHKELKIHQVLISSLILGFLCYTFYYLIIGIIGILFKTNLNLSFLEVITKKDVPLNFKEIVYVTGVSVLVGFIFTYLINYKVLHTIANKLKATNKFGDIDVWSFIMNIEEVEWVIIRDRENDLMYEGWIAAFSDSTEKDELFLRDVRVFKNSTAEELFKIPGLYLPRMRENSIIEFPSLDFSKYIERSEKEEKEQND